MQSYMYIAVQLVYIRLQSIGQLSLQPLLVVVTHRYNFGELQFPRVCVKLPN